ncbi:hypothetical protein Chor_013128 [Crotalus horridus]
MVELLQSDSDKVVRAVSIALRNLSMDRRNKDLIGSYAMGELVRNLPSRQQRSSKNLEEDTIVAVLNTIHEIITDSSENARSLIQTQGVQKLVAISKSRPFPNQHCPIFKNDVLDLDPIQTEFYFFFFIDNEKTGSRDMIPMDELGPGNRFLYNQLLFFTDGYSTIDHRDKERKYKTNDNMGDASEKEPLKNDTNRKTLNRSNRPSVTLVDTRDSKPQPVDSWV